ncbi:related to transposase [Sporisorium scitamineum]|uniref:Related to transposase n=1 Tax=Sporisorium scitamineum TaxID=49012 RepID=A0A127Z337_9BASI|nr:related to transposase [Sporisorium scitamineum]
MPQHPLLQELTVPCTVSAFNTTINAYHQETNPRDTWMLKRLILQAHEESQASIVVLEAENLILQAQQECNSKTLANLRRKWAKGDIRVLMKDRMITQEFAKQELVAKGTSMLRNDGDQQHMEEEDGVLPPSVAVFDGDKASEDGNEALSASAMTPSPPHMHTFLDELDDNDPLSTINNDNPGGFGFFDTVPVASSSYIRH